MSEAIDLNGIWSGTYFYPSYVAEEPVTFTAWIDDQDGALTGSILEINTFVNNGPSELTSNLRGSRSGLSVQFGKQYVDGQGAHDYIISYEGSVDSDFTEIAGEWIFVGHFHPKGRFVMSRSSEAHEERAKEKAIEEKI